MHCSLLSIQLKSFHVDEILEGDAQKACFQKLGGHKECVRRRGGSGLVGGGASSAMGEGADSAHSPPARPPQQQVRVRAHLKEAHRILRRRVRMAPFSLWKASMLGIPMCAEETDPSCERA